MPNDIKYPIAVSKSTGTLIDAADAENGLSCNCYCKLCDEDMIAVNMGKKQRAHFRHDKNSNCTATYETYIHWLTKEIFKTIKQITLPEIMISYADCNFQAY